MQPKHYFLFLIIAALFFLGYAAKGSFFGYDGYYFLSVVFGKMASAEGEFFTWFFGEVLPKDILLLKLCLMVPFLVNMLLTAKAGEVIFGKRGWLAGLLLVFNGVFIFESLKFEEEQFVYPFLFLALYAFVCLIKDRRYLLATLLPIGSIYYAYKLWLTNRWGDSSFIIPFMSEPEYIPLTNIFPMLIALGGIVGYIKDKRLLFLAIPAFILTIVALLIPKLAMFAAPFLALGLYAVFEKFEERRMINRKTVISLGVAVAILSIIFISIQMPFPYEFEAAEYAVEMSNEFDVPIINDWTYGYLIIWEGGETKIYGGGSNPTNFSNSIALTRSRLDCELLKSFNEINVYACLQQQPS